MALAYLKVVRVVCRCDLNYACTEFNINIFIGNNGNLSVGKRKLYCFATMLLYLSSSGLTAKALSPSSVSGRVVAISTLPLPSERG